MSRDDRNTGPDDPHDDWIGESLRRERTDDALPPGFLARARDRFEREHGAARSRSVWSRPLPWLGTVVAAALLALVFLPRIHDTSGRLTRPAPEGGSKLDDAIANFDAPAETAEVGSVGQLIEHEQEPAAKSEAAPERTRSPVAAPTPLPAPAPAPSQQEPEPEPKTRLESGKPAARADKDEPATTEAAAPRESRKKAADETGLRRMAQASAESDLRADPSDSMSKQAGRSALPDGAAESMAYRIAATPESARAADWPGPPVPDELLADWQAGSAVWWIPGQAGYRLVCRVEPESQTAPGPLQVTVARVRSQAGADVVGPGCLVRLELAGRQATIVYTNASE